MTDSEDGIVIADAKLRRELARKFPATWKRMQRRKKYLQEEIGIYPDDSVLLLSNVQARLMPCLLSPSHALVCRG